MNRRQFLAAVPASVASVGCVGDAGPLGPTATETAGDRRSSGGYAATVVDVRSTYDDETGPAPTGSQGDFQPTVTGSVDCAAGVATLEGWLATSSCRTVAIRSLRADDATDHVTVVLVDRWDQAGDPDKVDCAGITYNYRVRLAGDDGLPAEIRVVHRLHRTDSAERFTVTTDC